MALQAGVKHFPAGLMIDESIRAESADAGASNRTNVNVRLNDRLALDKRLGFASLTKARLDATTRAAGVRIFSDGEHACVLDSTTLDEYSEDRSVNVSHGRVPECSFATRPAACRVVDVADQVADVAYCNGCVAIAQYSNGAGYIAVEDLSGTILRPIEAVTGTGYVLLGAYSTYFIAVYLNPASANIVAYYLDTTSAATITTGWVSIGNVATDHNLSDLPGLYALSVNSLSDRVAFAYLNDSGGASRVTVKTITISGVLQTQTINTSSTSPDNLAIEGAITDTLWVAWNETTSVKVRGLSPSTLSSTLATTATIMTLDAAGASSIGIVSSATAGKARVIVTEGGGDRTQMRGVQTSAGAAATDGTQQRVPVARLMSRPFRVGTRYYALFDAYENSGASSTDFQKMCVLCDFTADQTWIRPVANIEPSLSSHGVLKNAHVVATTGSEYLTVISVKRSSDAQATEIITFDFAHSSRRSVARHAEVTYLGDALTCSYDRSRVAEVGFVPRPPKPTAVASSGTGLTGTFNYVVTYEQVDSSGRLTVSSVSDPFGSFVSSSTPAGLTVANKDINVTVRPCAITMRQLAATGGEVRIVIWRTSSTGLPPYYRLTSFNNITSSVFTTYNDTVADATLTTKPKLLGTGSLPATDNSALDRRCPTGLYNLVSHNGMLVGSRGPAIYYSSQDVGGEQPWFNPTFGVPVPEDVTGMVSMDGTLYVWSRRSIFAVVGDAPSDNGAVGGLGYPRRLVTDVGCIDPSSLVVTSMGAFFQSARGIELLTRSGSVVWVGEEVQDTTALYPVVTSAVVDDRNNVIRFSLATSRTGNVAVGPGRDLVFDMTFQKWSSIDDKRGSTAHEASQDAAVVYLGGVWRYAWLGTDGTLYYEHLESDADAYLDGSTWIESLYELPPIKYGLQQEQRTYEMECLFERHTDAGLRIEIATDFGDFPTETDKVWTTTDIATKHAVPFRPKPRGNAVALRVRDVAPVSLVGNSGRGLTFIGVSVDSAPKQGPTRGTPRLETGLRR